MRIVVVSAHFPPNFVSGGTLQPQRLARALRARGHDVSVYAGWLGDRPPLETWDDVDETGLPVRWVASGRWIGWDDEHNFDNPDVGADFAAHLARLRPDVVHLHALQSLGANLVPIAAAAGAKVVLTMHDFWWCCARQFLVDREMRQCSLVVAAGCCPCQVDREWLDARNRRLLEMVAGADRILAPSASAAGVLAANGVDPVRLAVDENGLPAGDHPAAGDPVAAAAGPAAGEPSPPGPVRFLFTGGSNPMKGAQVLFEATAALAALPGWRLTAYGWDGTTRDDMVAPPSAAGAVPVDVRPPFDPARIDAVYAGADVMVVPSLMRESYSLATREALVRGLPVVCSDTLGPEEVVVHGRNGLVVPAGDASPLAAALRSLVCDPALLARLRDGCRSPLPVRSLDDQADGLERMYTQLLSGGPGPATRPTATAAPAATRRRRVRRVLFVVGIEGAPLRYRARLPAEGLALLGIHCDVLHYRHPDVPSLAAQAGAVVVYRVPATVEILAVVESVRDGGAPVVFDVDDLIFDPDVAPEIPAIEILPPEEAELWMEGVRRYRTTMEACDAFVGSTPALCRHATEVTGMPAWRFDNGVGIVLGAASDAALREGRRPGPPRLGYASGTNTHDLDWAYVEPAVVDILSRHPDVELWLTGLVTPSAAIDAFGDRVVRAPFQPWTDLPGLLRQVDVNLAPLTPASRFNESKSAIKWLEAALVETPTVASPTEAFRDAIAPGVNGMLASSTSEWAGAIERLLVDPDLRRSVGRRARRDALLRWSPHLQARRYRDILESVERRDRAAASLSGWAPVVHSEPFHPFQLEPYGVAAPVGDGSGPAVPAPGRAQAALTGAGRLVARLRDSVRTDGPGATVVRLSRYSARAVRRRLSR